MLDPQLHDTLNGLAEPNPAPELFERVSRWRRSCGDAVAAGRWQLWSLLPPERPELEKALAELWLSQGETAQAAALLPAHGASWERLALLLEQGHLDQARALQAALLAAPPNLSDSQLLALAGAWQQQQCPDQALQLLEQLVRFYGQRSYTITPTLANALAQVLEQAQRYGEAAQWWRHSLQQYPQQVAPLMRLARQAMREQQPAAAVHYCREVLTLDPGHAWAPQLLQQALEAHGARGSLALLRGEPLPAPWRRRQQRWLEPLRGLVEPGASSDRSAGLIARGPVLPLPLAAAEGAEGGGAELALWGDADGLALVSVLQQVAVLPHGLRVIWLLASPEPLLQQHNLERLLQQPGALKLRWWPCWDPQQHARLTGLALAKGARDAPAEHMIPAGCRLWRRGTALQGWHSDPAIYNANHALSSDC